MSSDRPDNPLTLFGSWFADAEKSEPNDPTAFALATTTPEGQPSVRMVLLKAFDERGFVFYTNLESRKADELHANARAAMCFHWKSLRRQIRIEGTVTATTQAEADAYFESRPRASQIGAWASKQSRAMEGRFELEKRFAQFTAKFGIGTVPRPEFWSGFRIAPHSIEFWSSHQFRLHDRFVYRRKGDGWTIEDLYP
jgi:pyridoxamine 5'-phosphate oxidase